MGGSPQSLHSSAAEKNKENDLPALPALDAKHSPRSAATRRQEQGPAATTGRQGSTN